MKKLVAYYSLSGNTKFVAEKIAHQIGADLCEVIDKKNRTGKLTYLTGGMAAFREQLTEIEVSRPIDGYDFVAIGSPMWAGKIAPAIRKFLVTNDFSNKQVAYFVTAGGDKPEKALNNVKETIAIKQVIGELGIGNASEDRAKIENQVKEWCSQIQKTL